LRYPYNFEKFVSRVPKLKHHNAELLLTLEVNTSQNLSSLCRFMVKKVCIKLRAWFIGTNTTETVREMP